LLNNQKKTRLKFTLTQKGIILVAIPLLFEVAFLGALAFLLAQAEQESNLVFKSANIGNCSNKLLKDIFELSAIPHSEIVELLTSNGYKNKIETIRTDLNELSTAVKDNPQQEQIIKKSVAAGEEAFILVEQLQSTFASGNTLAAIDQLKQLRGELRACIQQMISTDLIAMAQSEKLKAEEYHKKQLTSRAQIQALLIFGLILNAVVTFIVAFLITKKIVGKLETLVDNNFRLVSGLPLNPLIGGNDEISNLDSTFHEMANALAEAKQKEQSMIEHSVDFICSLDGNGKLTAANPACNDILGYTQDAIIGMNLKSILADEDVESFNKVLDSAIAGNTETKFESGIKQQDSDIIDVSWSIHWVDSEQSFFCVGHNITARKEVERLKQQFMAMISHDLRTPLTTIGNYLEMLSSGMFGQLSEKGLHLLKITDHNAERMLNLINDLLDLERAEFGGLKLNYSENKISDIIDAAVNSIATLAAENQINIDVTTEDLIVAADANRIGQVLVNLLNNAIKFSPKNSTIKVCTIKENNKAIIKISDEGRGIPLGFKDSIFERFKQVEITDAADQGGSGLGLAICKTIVELHGGEIAVENNTFKGSTFSFTLPIRQATAVV
jgi:PAS domain S-box-containing protein